mmetsp:Transcript_27843/g.58941  ORF Transcript_27843/g.58941 Transcript_27843/m.58941 type:complete len:126 (+) Transcript_27843:48-425(+)
MAADPAVAAKEQAAIAAADFQKRAAQVREYYEVNFGTQMREGLTAVARERPADPRAALAQHFQGKRSLGEIANLPKTTDPALRSAAPRHFLNSAAAPAVVPALVHCFHKQPRRAVSELGEEMAKG